MHGQKLKDVNIDVIIGSDLIWQSSMVPGLIDTLNVLFDTNENAVFYHCYAERSLDLHLQLLKSYRENHFIVEYVGQQVVAAN